MKIKILDLEFETQSLQGLTETVVESLGAEGPRMRLSYLNLMSLDLRRRVPEVRCGQDLADIVVVDSTWILWALKLKGYAVDYSWRATMLDWLPDLFQKLESQSCRIFLLGSTVKNIDKAKSDLESLYKSSVFDAHHGYFHRGLEGEVIDSINSFEPDLLLVGMGVSEQEAFVNRNFGTLNAKIVVPVGGFFDYIAGAQKTPPRWTGKFGLEWLYRLLSNPGRLFKRYVVEPWPLISKLVVDILRSKKRSKK